jgi:hypothetical protein
VQLLLGLRSAGIGKHPQGRRKIWLDRNARQRRRKWPR